jgi:hypothetical protein
MFIEHEAEQVREAEKLKQEKVAKKVQEDKRAENKAD